MKTIYNHKAFLAVCFALLGFAARAQVLTPFNGNNSVPAGTIVTLCSHLGCGSGYNNNASGYTVLNAGSCAGITISGDYDVESCCDEVNIYDGAGTGGTLLQTYAGSGSMNFTGAPGQTLTVELISDGSVTYSGFQFTVNTGPAIQINGGVTDYTICSGHPLTLAASGANTYTWSTGSNLSSFLVSPATNTVYTVAGEDANYPGCPLSNTVNVTVNQSPVIAISGGSVMCGNANPVILTVGGFADSFLWSTGATGLSISVSPMQPTTYYVTATFASNGCTTTQSRTVLYSPNPSLSIFTPTTTICEGSSVNIFATGADTYTWNNGSQSALTTVSPVNTTTFTVLGLNSYGCQGSASQVITVNAMPPVNATASKNLVCAGDMLTLTGTGASTYVWMANSFYSSGSIITIYPQTTTIYTVTGTDVNGCNNVAQVNVSVSACTGLNEVLAATGMRVYPNPASSDFTVEFDNALLKTIDVIDLTGRVVLTGSSQENKLDFNIQQLANGIYYVRAKSDDAVDMIKIVKQ